MIPAECELQYDQKIFRFGECGYWLYYELHTDLTNAFIHAVGMHAVVFGALLATSALFGNLRTHIPTIIFAAFIFYYYSFTPDASFTMFYFMPAALASVKKLQSTETSYNLFINGAIWMFSAIILQELLGHCLFEHALSELGQIPNSIAVAPLFAARSSIKVANFLVDWVANL